jgi:hypothetical protein
MTTAHTFRLAILTILTITASCTPKYGGPPADPLLSGKKKPPESAQPSPEPPSKEAAPKPDKPK